MGSKRKAQKQLTKDNAAEHDDEHDDDEDDSEDHARRFEHDASSQQAMPTAPRKKVTARRSLAPQSPLATHSVRAAMPSAPGVATAAPAATANGFLGSLAAPFNLNRLGIPPTFSFGSANAVSSAASSSAAQQLSGPFSFNSPPQQPTASTTSSFPAVNVFSSASNNFAGTGTHDTGATYASKTTKTANAASNELPTNVFSGFMASSPNGSESVLSNVSKKPTGMDFSKFTSSTPPQNFFVVTTKPSSAVNQAAGAQSTGFRRHAPENDDAGRSNVPPPYSSTDKNVDALKALLSDNRFKLPFTALSNDNASSSSSTSRSSTSLFGTAGGSSGPSSQLSESVMSDCMTQIHTKFGLLNAAFEKAFLHSTKFFISADCSPLMMQYCQEASKLCDMAQMLGRLSIIKEFSRHMDRYQRVVEEYEIEGRSVSSSDRIPGPLQPIISNDFARGRPRVEDLVSSLRQQEGERQQQQRFSRAEQHADDQMSDDNYNSTLISSTRRSDEADMPASTSSNLNDPGPATTKSSLNSAMQFANWTASSSSSSKQQPSSLSTGFNFSSASSSSTAAPVSGGFKLPGAFPPPQQQQEKSSTAVEPIGFKLGGSTSSATLGFNPSATFSTAKTGATVSSTQAQVGATFSFGTSSLATPTATAASKSNAPASSASFDSVAKPGFSMFKPLGATTTTTTTSSATTFATAATASSTPQPFSFNFGASSTPSNTTAATASTSTSTTTLGSKPTGFGAFPAAAPFTGFGSSSSSAAPGTPAPFGATPTTAAATFSRQPFTNNFNFGSNTAASSSQQTSPSSSGFSFAGLSKRPTDQALPVAGTSSNADVAAGEAGNDADDDAKPYEPPKPEVVDVSEPGALFSVKCKLLYFDSENNKWESKALGMAHLKKMAEGQRACQLIVRMSNALGTVLLNVRLHLDDNRVKTTGKDEPGKNACLQFLSVSMPPIDEKHPDKLYTFMMRVKSADDRNKFIDTVRSLST